jgi:multidrug efflux pump subunit AcrB
LFKPLAFTKTYSMGFAAILAVTLTPALAAIFIRGKIVPEERHPVNRLLMRAYAPVVRWAIRYRTMVIGGAVLLIAFTVPLWFRLSSDFMPPLNEGVILYMPTAPPGMSIAEASHVLKVMDKGVELARNRPSAGLEFTSDVARGHGCTIFLAAGSLQYVDESLPAILARIGSLPRHLIINKLPMYDGEAFVTLQYCSRTCAAAI